jgi:hypothetical protein
MDMRLDLLTLDEDGVRKYSYSAEEPVRDVTNDSRKLPE